LVSFAKKNLATPLLHCKLMLKNAVFVGFGEKGVTDFESFIRKKIFK
jgi:hypothetical protein